MVLSQFAVRSKAVRRYSDTPEIKLKPVDKTFLCSPDSPALNISHVYGVIVKATIDISLDFLKRESYLKTQLHRPVSIFHQLHQFCRQAQIRILLPPLSPSNHGCARQTTSPGIQWLISYLPL